MGAGDGTTGHIFMLMSMDIGQDKEPAVHMKQVIGIADHVVKHGSGVAGTEKIEHQAVIMIMTTTEGKYPKVIAYSCCE